MYFRYSRIFWFIATLALTASAQESAQRDTASQSETSKVYTLPEFVISATRWKSRIATLPSSVTVVTCEELSRFGDGTLGAALHGVVGLYVKSYGGPGSVSTTSIRGMGAEHTLVLVDGQRNNSVRDGQVDFGIFPVQNIERVEVLRGGFSSIYGADALGGIINIVTRRPGLLPRVEGELTSGSYGMHGGQASASFSVSGIGLLLSACQETGRGDYEFRFHDGVNSMSLNRQNADYRIQQFRVYAEGNPIEGANVSWSVNYNRSERGSPGAVLTASSINSARLKDALLQSQAAFEWGATSRLSVHVSTLFNLQRRTYSDPGLGGNLEAEESDFSDREFIVTPHLRYVVNRWTSLNLGGELSHSSVSSRQLLPAGRSQESVFFSSEHSVDFGGDIFHQLNIFPSARYDHLTGLDGELSPRIGLNLGLWKQAGLRLKASVGKNFRAPSFNDLYWKGGGNPFLRPERSLGADAGLVFTLQALGQVDVDVSVFDIRTTDRIVWTPDGNGLWTPKNLQRVRSAGFEVVAGWRALNERLRLKLSYTNADARKTGSATTDDQTLNKQLPYLPHETAAIAISLRLEPVVLDLRHEYTGFRYTTETNDARFVLQPYQKTDVNISTALLARPVSATAHVGIENLFNADYQIFPNFPMPLRMYNVRLSLEY